MNSEHNNENSYENYNEHYTSQKITDAQNEVALSYDRARGLYFLAVVFAASKAY